MVTRIQENATNEANVALLAIFDGHGGMQTSEAIRYLMMLLHLRTDI